MSDEERKALKFSPSSLGHPSPFAHPGPLVGTARPKELQLSTATRAHLPINLQLLAELAPSLSSLVSRLDAPPRHSTPTKLQHSMATTNPIQGPRPYPYPRPIPPPPIPHQLADPISCYKCHSPSLPLPTPDSTQVYAAESYYRQVLTATWRTQIDQVEAVQLANQLEQQGLLERWLEHLLEVEGLDPTKVGEKQTVEESREGIKEAVRIVTSREQMETRMERVLKRTMESVLVRMLSVCSLLLHFFHSILHRLTRTLVRNSSATAPFVSTTSSNPPLTKPYQPTRPCLPLQPPPPPPSPSPSSAPSPPTVSPPSNTASEKPV